MFQNITFFLAPSIGFEPAPIFNVPFFVAGAFKYFPVPSADLSARY